MRRVVLVCLALVAASACSLGNVSCGLTPPAADEGQPIAAERPLGEPITASFGISFLGDSLTAGYGLLSQQAYPAVLEEMFAAEGYNVSVVNAGLSGDTSAGGLRRVSQAFQANTHIVVVALGGNDALRGLSARQTYDNLAAIIEAARARGASVMLAGMQAPTNLGPDYQDAFRATYQRLSTTYASSLTFVPFLLEGVAAVPELNQMDGIHPNEQGARKIAELLYPSLRTMVDQAGGGGG